MKVLKILFFGLFVFCAGIAFSDENLISWGGPGGDNAQGSRFSAKESQRPSAEAVEITCDLGEKNSGILEIHLVDAKGAEAIGSECWATERHITAPVACVVNRADLVTLSGEGKIVIMDRNKVSIVEEPADLDAVKGVAGFLQDKNDNLELHVVTDENVDIKVFIDDKIAVDEQFRKMSAKDFIGIASHKIFKFSLKSGKHMLRAEALGGTQSFSKEFEVDSKKWIALYYVDPQRIKQKDSFSLEIYDHQIMYE